MKNEKHMTRLLFMLYLLLLTWIIVMKMEFSFDAIYRMRSLNLIPLEGTAVYNNQLHYEEIYLNILIFIPFGLYLSMLKPKWSFLKKLIPIFLASLSFESLQYLFSIGASDITDLIGNTLGGLIGIISYRWMVIGLKDHHKAQRLFNLLGGTVTFAFFLLSLFFLLTSP